ncbi:MAG: ATPase domain-containing protein [archaeon]
MGLIANVEKKKKELKKEPKIEKKEASTQNRLDNFDRTEKPKEKVDTDQDILAKLDRIKKQEEKPVVEEKLDVEKEVLEKLDKIEKPKEKVEEKNIDTNQDILERLDTIKKQAEIKPSEKKEDKTISKEKEIIEKVVDAVEKPKKKSPFAEIKRQIEGKLRRSKPEFNLKETMEDIKEEIEDELGTEKKFVKTKGRIATGLPGLDQLMEGGFLDKSMVLVVGGAGSGKSIFSMQFLVNGVQDYNETGIYITFEQNEEKVLRDYERFEWNIVDKVKKGNLVILPYTPEQVDRFLDSGGGIVRDIIDKIGAKRVVVDSVSAFLLLFPNELDKRRAVFRLYETMSKWGCTTLLIDEHEPHPKIHESTVIEFQADTVLLLYNQRKGDIRERSMEIFKMRATQHTQKIFPMKIDDSGITIYPDASVF